MRMSNNVYQALSKKDPQTSKVDSVTFSLHHIATAVYQTS